MTTNVHFSDEARWAVGLGARLRMMQKQVFNEFNGTVIAQEIANISVRCAGDLIPGAGGPGAGG